MSFKDDDIAVIGMSGRFPGANSVAEFWENLCAKKDGIRTLSDEALRAAGVAERDIVDRAYVKASATLDDIEMFDAGFFKVSPLEAEILDPQVRLLLQCAWETLEDAGYAKRQAQRIGVFAGAGGVTTSYFSNFVNVNERFEKITASPAQLGNDKDFLSTYLSYKLNLTGPSMTVQTACSTSLVALHLARSSLLNGECDMALAGGVTVRVPHGQGYRHREGYIFSKSGRVRAFDESADGVVFGSGLGLVLIRKLSDAIADGDPIHAVIKGSAIVNDGKGKMSYAASSARGQISCVRAALKSAALTADEIGFVEAHGTGTAMGDPEEVKALSQVFKEQTEKKCYCALGAVKTNVGHSEAAAGIIGFIKAALAVKHGLIPPTLHYSTPNPRIKFENTPFFINGELREWNEGGRPRVAAVNSLGVGGTNAFVIIEQHVSSERPAHGGEGPFIVPLSAKTEPSLHAYAQKFADFLAARKVAVDLSDIAYTLQGRDAMDRRVAFVASHVDELQTQLTHYLQGAEIAGARGEAADLAASWIAGSDIDWSRLYAKDKPRRVSLPTYAFAKDRYWIDTGSVAPSRAVIHPLLHVNTSDLSEQKYTSTFTSDEFFLKDHQVRLKRTEPRAVLPAVAYLEMARAAIEQATSVRDDGSFIELRNVAWLQPIVVSEATQVSIALLPRNSADQIDFEIYTNGDVIHCQGQCSFNRDGAAPTQIDVAALKASMQRCHRSSDELYAAFIRMGLHYGPTCRPIDAIESGEHELVAQLTLPDVIASSESDYVLHPSLMDGALQAAAMLLFDPQAVPSEPIVPFALETLRVCAPCKREMIVWARFSAGSHPEDESARLDIDLIDANGNVCVEMRGYTPRALGKASFGTLLATQEWQVGQPNANQTMNVDRRVIVVDLPQVDAQSLTRDGSSLQSGEQCIAGDATSLRLDRGKSIAERYDDLALACFDRVQALISGRPQGAALIQVVLPNSPEHALYGGLSGLFKTTKQENPRIAGQLIFVDADIGADDLAQLLTTDGARAHDTLIRYDDGVRQVASWRLLNEDGGGTFNHDAPFKKDGVYLITGGLGGLGVMFAKEIITHASNATIVLTGRASPADIHQSASKQAILDSLRASGATVDYWQLDLGSRRNVENVTATIVKTYRQLNGIIHCAGMTSDSFILNKTPEEFRRVLTPKTAGTHHLDYATRDFDLDFMVLFSSLTSAVGNVGQADYAAANGFMDAFSAYRNRLVQAGERRGMTLTIRWPLWQDGGMHLKAADEEALYEATGTHPMQTATGMRMFYRSLALGLDQTLAMEGEPRRMQQSLGVGAIAHTKVETPKLDTTAQSDLAALTERYLCTQLAATLKLTADRIDPRAPLENYGIDSILSLDLTRMLEKTFGALPKTLFFEYLTIRDLATYFADAHPQALTKVFERAESSTPHTPAETPTAAQAPPVSSIRLRRSRLSDDAARSTQWQTSLANEPIAIVGLSGRYPESRDLETYWRNLRDGKDCIVEVPKDRWDWREYYSEDRSQPGRHFSKWGGFIEGVDEFDARFFNISPVEAATLDPQERLFLQHAWMAIEDASYTRARLQIPKPNDLPAQVGVYAGVMYSEYQLFGAEASLKGNRIGFASNPASIANRVSYFLNLHGPSMVVDTMCSSSLTAIHLACQDLKLGRTSLGIAGGVNVTIHPNKYLMLSAGQFISGDGQCQSFGEGGDGYIPGEGVGVVVLKRLSDAERDGDRIYGVIRGSALSHGGKTNGYTVPNPQAQASAIRQALAEAGVDPRHVSYVEAHGTGTKLGDPIEIAALTKVFKEGTQDTGFCRIGSAKSNIGHGEAAAGIAGLTKVLLQLKHRHIVASLHSSRLNPHIDFESTPFVVNQTITPWEQPVVDGKALPRIAGISSFGAGGSNAHLVIEEYSPPSAPMNVQPRTEFIVPLSARTPEQLRQKARDLADFIRAGTLSLDLPSLAYTLQVGREAMDERLGVLVTSVAALADKLQGYLDGNDGLEGVYRGEIKSNRDTLALLTQDPDLHATIEEWIGNRKHSKLAPLWVKGLELDWRKFHPNPPRPISLPSYPFSRQRFWIDTTAGTRGLPAPSTATALHPLLHRNTSDFSQQSYASTFVGDEFFLAGPSEQRRFSEATCLEMARAAIDASMPARSETGTLELRDVAWAQPGVAIDNLPVTIALFDKNDEQVKFEIYSTTADGCEVVHCQGAALRSHHPAPAKVDLDAQDEQTFSTELRLPATLEANQSEYVIHPALMQTALEAAKQSQPISMMSLRVIFPYIKAKFARVRHASSADDAIDIDLCDEHGNACTQMRGLRYSQPAIRILEVSSEAASVEASRPVAFAPAEVQFDVAPSFVPGTPLLEKPNASIVLTAPSASMSIGVESGVAAKPAVSLSAATGVAGIGAPSRPAAINLFDHSNGIFSIRIDAPASRNALSADLIADLLGAIRTVQDASSAKVLMIEGSDGCFLTGGRENHQHAVASKLYRALVEFPYPVIAVASGDALGAGFLVASVCDFIVCSESARYAFVIPEQEMYPSLAEEIFIERYGRVLATDLLYLSTKPTGAELKAKGWTCRILPRDEAIAHAQALATNLARKSQISLRLAKHHLARRLASDVQALRVPVAEVATLVMDATTAKAISAPSARVQVEARERVLVVTIRAQAEASSAAALLADVKSVFDQIDEASPYRCVVMQSELAEFLPNVRADSVRAFKEALLSLNRPIVAALSANASGMAWTVAQFCDVCVHSENGRYSYGDASSADESASIYSVKFGAELAKQILLTGAEWSGRELRNHGALHVVSPDHVLPRALEVAESLARFPVSVLAAWKERTAKIILELASAVGASLPPTAAMDDVATAGSPVAVPLESTVISAIAHPHGILEVRMADRAARNMFSDAFSRGMHEVFAHVRDNHAYKVVVLTGYDNYFSSGGTRETLLAIHEGKVKFTDDNVFELPLTCAVPVIAAMQGHGIGAGWAMGMYADLVLFSEESRYCSPYMGYGFTPGAGATLMFPEKIGHDLARETLLTAQEYSGAELAERRLCHPVLPRKQVMPAAMALARQIAQSSRRRLVTLKQSWASAVQASLPETLEREVAMHERTFVGQADALARIQSSFGADSVPVATIVAAAPAAGAVDLGAIAIELKKMLAQELHMQEHEIGEGEQFVELGLDSITGVTWIRKINEKYGTAIEAIQIYSHPTLAQFTRYVTEETGKANPQVAAPQVAEPVVRIDAPRVSSVVTSLASWRNRDRPKAATGNAVAADSRIAVVGMAGQFARARNLEEFWRNIQQGKDCIDEVPKHRWDIGCYYQEGEPAPGKTTSKWMGALEDYDRFDAAFFNVSPREARSMDPQQRLFLQTCWQSIEHAGYNPKALAGTKCGVYVGCAAGDYHQLSKRERLSGLGFTGAATSILAARISYFLDLHGPSLCIDTACSSSLVAIASACESLVAGTNDIALAGGVNVMASPAMQIMTAQVGLLSPQGRCFTFDERANGIVTGEGVGVLMLKRLADAEREGDCIYGVIEGWGVNQAGKTNGITAPSADAQARLQQQIYDKFGIDPASIQLIEAQGTATALGDPIEVAGLNASFKKYTRKRSYCALGSVKTNIGHCLTAAGVAGFIKVLQALNHQQLPATLHFGKLNKHISLQDSPFYINDQLRDWPENGIEPRRAAVNSFGFSGTNAHVVISEYRGQAQSAAAPELTIVPLSARTADQLLRKARDLLTFLREQDNAALDLRAIARTLQTGREEMNERVAFVTSVVTDLQHKLQACIETLDVGTAPNVYRGEVSGNADTVSAFSADPDFQRMIAKWMGRRELTRLADLWTKGLVLPWSEFYAVDGMPRRVALPVYPFARERHWIDLAPDEPMTFLAEPEAQDSTSSVTTEQPQVRHPVKAGMSLDELRRQLTTSLADALMMKPADIEPRRPFTELGLDSIIGVEWVKSINQRYRIDISPTRVYDYPSVKALASFLIGELPRIEPLTSVPKTGAPTTRAAAAVVQKIARRADPAREKVAIIGMSCRFPKSENSAALWNNLKAGKDCITEVPVDRWQGYSDWYNSDPRNPHTSYSKWGGFLDNVDAFDPLFFGISPAEAEVIDPQQRIFLEECWNAIESAGYASSALSNQSCGVYVGCGAGDYSRVLANDGQDTVGAAFMGMSNSILAARISYYLNLKGPALAIDTACSSSLVAVHLACESIRSGENEMALAGGVNVLTTPLGHILTSQVGMPSQDGRCATFDASANGIVFSEGCGVLLLKRLSQALLDNDEVLGVIEGSGVNQDGKTNGITAPSSIAQEQLLRQVYSKFAIDPKRIGYVEAHGTATPLGDPIEVNALTSAFRRFTDKKNYCALGSVKTNIGHTGLAAGVAGIAKVLLCIKHQKLAPSIHYREPNPHIDFEQSPFYVNTQYRDWVSDQPRMASVSSFGFSGTNAHVVIGQYVSSSESGATSGDVFVPLSSKAADQLHQKARDLLSFIRDHEQPVDLVRLAYTLQVGRDAMDHRLGFLVGSVEQLADKLQAWLDGNTPLDDSYHGRSSHDDALSAFVNDVEMQAVIDRWIAQNNLPKLAQLWARGLEIDWNLLYDGTKPRRMSLPTYPFARERCWVQGTSSRKTAASRNDVATLHPLLHRNTSDLSQQSYTSTFEGNEFFLTDHRVREQRVLPAVAYLEIARAALVYAMPAEQASRSFELSNVVWMHPIVVAEEKSIAIALFSEHGARLGFEIYSNDDDDSEDVIHCQGNCIVGDRPAAKVLDLGSLRARMSRGRVEGAALYPMFAKMGLQYGPAFQGIVEVLQGENQLLVELRLTEAARRHGGTYVLHPSMMDSALQGAVTLIQDVIKSSGTTWLPFAIESVRIISACTEQMVAWIRYPDGQRSVSTHLAKVDIDLFDRNGNVCVEMRGLSSRPMERAAVFDDAHYQSVIERVLSHQISPDEAIELG